MSPPSIGHAWPLVGLLAASCVLDTTPVAGGEGGKVPDGMTAASTGFPTLTDSDPGEWGGGEEPQQRFAVVGDYGSAGPAEARVAELVRAWKPDFVATTGDNNYPSGSAVTIDDNVGQYYAPFIGEYQGSYGEGSARNRFWPTPGNHDWGSPDLQGYRDYFTLPGNERYYEIEIEQVHLFAFDSDVNEPDGITEDSVQGQWLKEALAASQACWKVVLLHHPPYSSGAHGSSEQLRLPFAEWGADVVIAGHDHIYERLEVDGVAYYVNGLGGRSIYGVGAELQESKFRYNDDYGALFFMVGPGELRSTFYDAEGQAHDQHRIMKACP